MSVIRPIRASEADRFLEILCDVFELDFVRARSVFYSEPSFDLERKWALFQGGEMVSILTTTPLAFGDGAAIGIAGVATRQDMQGRGLAARLINEVCAVSESKGEGRALLFAKRTTVYERCGFRALDEVVRGEVVASGECDDPADLTHDEVRRRYSAWAESEPRALRRNDFRWNIWTYNLKVCEPFGEGYFCFEGNIMREALILEARSSWPVPLGTEWYGLSSMTKAMNVPGSFPFADLYLMGRGFAEPPLMFMTDQF